MVPTSFIFYLEVDDKRLAIFPFMIGMLALLWGFVELWKEKHHAHEVLKAQSEAQKYFDHKADVRHKELIEEIKKLRGGQDDRPSTNQ